MSRLLLVLALALSLGGCDDFGSINKTFNYGTINNGSDNHNCSGCEQVIGSGVLKVEERAVQAFTAIEQDNTGQIFITQGDTEKLTIEGDDNVLPVLVSEVRNGVLHLSVETGKGYSSVKKLVYRITVRSLDRIDLRGTASANIRSVKGQRLAVYLSGTGALTATGKVTEFRLSVSGTSSVDAHGLFVQRANVSLTGTGSARLAVNKEIDARLSGTGSLSYSGRAHINSAVTGTGAIAKI